jgi:uncharacterized protein (TIGR03643 family)
MTEYQSEDHPANVLSVIDRDRIIEMAWEDRTPFEAILVQFGLKESEVIALMRSELKQSSFRLWRKRVNQKVSSKHLKKRSEEISRFKSRMQRDASHNKISKRPR